MADLSKINLNNSVYNIKDATARTNLTTHTGNTTVHITAAERTAWNAKQDALTIDTAMSSTSTNPVQNKVINTALGTKQNTITAGAGLSFGTGTAAATLGHSNSITAGTAGTSSATSGSTLAVPYVTYNAQGHITAVGTHTHTVTGFQAPITAGAGLSFGTGTAVNTLGHSNSITAGTVGTSSATSGSTLAVPYVTYNAQGHITAVGTHTHTVTGFQAPITAGTGLAFGTGTAAATLGHSNSVTAGSVGTSSATSGSTLAVPWVTFDSCGHMTNKGTHTHTISGFVPTAPSSTAVDAAAQANSIVIGKAAASSANIPAAYASLYINMPWSSDWATQFLINSQGNAYFRMANNTTTNSTTTTTGTWKRIAPANADGIVQIANGGTGASALTGLLGSNGSAFYANYTGSVVADCNSATTGGLYRVNSSSTKTNAPASGTYTGILIVFQYAASNVGQLAVLCRGNGVYYRQLYSSTWSSWTKL